MAGAAEIPDVGEQVRFRCNVCSAANELRRDEFGREAGACGGCGSTVRWRAIVFLLSLELFGQGLALEDFPSRPDIVGLGLSDWEGYAIPLSRRLAYTNTYLHRAPRLDITEIDPELEHSFDFVIASDVLEHVAPPVAHAFRNLRELLRRGGFAIVTVPYERDGATVEHFPELHRYELQHSDDGAWELVNETASGEEQRFRDLVFHGGPGETLEMRVFAEEALRDALHEAGFASATIESKDAAEWGVVWNEDRSLPIVARDYAPPQAGA